MAETYPAKKKGPPLYAMRTEERKVVWQPGRDRWEWYDLVRDPGERERLDGSGEEAFRSLAEDLRRHLVDRPAPAITTIDDARGGPDEETRAALESLGYVD